MAYLVIQRQDKNKPYSPVFLRGWDASSSRPGEWATALADAQRFELGDLPALLVYVRPLRGYAVKLVTADSVCTLSERHLEGRRAE